MAAGGGGGGRTDGFGRKIQIGKFIANYAAVNGGYRCNWKVISKNLLNTVCWTEIRTAFSAKRKTFKRSCFRTNCNTALSRSKCQRVFKNFYFFRCFLKYFSSMKEKKEEFFYYCSHGILRDILISKWIKKVSADFGAPVLLVKTVFISFIPIFFIRCAHLEISFLSINHHIFNCISCSCIFPLNMLCSVRSTK